MTRHSVSLTLGIVWILCVGLVGGVGAEAATDAEPAPSTAPSPDFGAPVPGSSLPDDGGDAAPDSSDTVTTPEPVGLAPAEAVTVDLPAEGGDGTEVPTVDERGTAGTVGEWREIPDRPLSIASAESDGDAARSVEVRVLDAAQVEGMDGADIAIELTRADESSDPVQVALRVPDAVLEGMYGADYANRLTWTQVSTGDEAAEAAEVPAMQTDGYAVVAPLVSSRTTRLMAASSAASSSGTGSFGATPLKSSSAWDVAEQTGGFSWTYDMPLPPAGAGPQPAAGLSYNSQAVDGLTGSTNNQPSVVGEGWELNGGGFIERRYVSCATDDGATGAVTTSGDLCWKSENATVSIAGHAGALVKDQSSGKWRMVHDDGTRFEYLQGTGQGCSPNGTNSTDCWRMTTTDGTQYYFGLNRLPGWSTGKAETNSTWIVPVFGNDPGEPCKASTFAASSCMQAWRWNLDYIVDVNGNAQANFYTAETNKYAKNGAGATSYVRGGVLSRIEYGLRASNLYGANAAGFKVSFTYDAKGRCADATGAACTTQGLGNATQPTTPSKYPDVPWDRLCTGSTCLASQASPSFFTNARLSAVQAQVLVSGAYSTTDSWVLSHSFPDPGDGTNAALWLTKVQHTSSRAGQAAITTPATAFSGITLQNRVWAVDGLVPLSKWRLSSIKTELGAVVSVNYAQAQCTPSDVPTLKANPESNTKWCFPEWWIPENVQPAGPRLDLFHKYRVDSVNVDAVTGPALSKVMRTQYFYGTPRWRYNESELVPANRRTWNSFAGVDTVEVRAGDPAAPSEQKVTKSWYYQGMNGDRANAAGGTRIATVMATSIPDEKWFGGQTHRQQVLLGVGGAVLGDTTSTPWASSVTSSDGNLTARIVRTGRTFLTEPLSAGGNRTLETLTTFDSSSGLPTSQSTVPSDATAKCVTTSYASPNTSAWIIGAVSEAKAVAKSCADASSVQLPRDLISQERTAYDGLGWGAAPTKGLVTSEQIVDAYDGTTPHWAQVSTASYDALGRVLSATDALGRTTATSYTPSNALPLTATSTTNPAPFSWVTTTTYEPTTGTQSSITDPNGAVTSVDVDGLGRTAKVWMPLRPKSVNPDSPSLSYDYTLSQTSPNVTKTTTYKAGANVQSFELFDGLGRTVQLQGSASSGGTVVKTTAYDGQGRAYWVDNPYWTTSVNPSTSLFVPDSQNAIPARVVTDYDAIGRVVKVSLSELGQLRSESSANYRGADRVDAVPASGGTPTSTFKNSLGQKTMLLQHLSAGITATGQATTYGYDGAGHLVSMRDPAGNAWAWEFDLKGNRVSHTDPDAGKSTATVDAVGNVTSTTDARGQTLTTTFDALNRRTATFSGSTSGALLSSWTYDSVKKGMVTASTSYVGSVPGTPGAAYTNTVVSYDAAGNVTRSTVSIPSSAPAFAGTTYTTTAGYYADSAVSVRNVPSIGGLPSEQILYSYDAYGRLSGVRGNGGILNNTIYTPTGQIAQFNRLNTGAEAYSTYGYDNATGEVLSIKDNAVFGGSGHWVADRSYVRDQVGNITSATTSSVLPTPRTQVYCYGYDALRQLTRAWSPQTVSACSGSPAASSLSGPAPLWVDYGYDSLTGNRTSVTSRDTNGTTKTATYQYPTAGSSQPHAVRKVVGASSLGSGDYGTDAAGHVTVMPGKTVSYDEAGRVGTVTASSVSEALIYDTTGSLLLRVNSVEGASLYLGDTTLLKKPGSTTVFGSRTYKAADGIPVAMRSGNTGQAGSVVTWLFADITGTIDTRSVASTGATEQVFRDPFGNALAGGAAFWANGNGYLNQPGTATTALTTLGARMYSAILGKFLTVDPVTDPNNPQQNTGYTYGHNNPLTSPDPSGLAPGLMLSDGCGRGSCSASTAGSILKSSGGLLDAPPSYSSSAALGRALTSAGQVALNSVRPGDWMTKSVAENVSDSGIRARAYVNMNAGSFYRSQQGALVYGWMIGVLPSTVNFGPKSSITDGLRRSPTGEAAVAAARNALAGGAEGLQSTRYNAGRPGPQNPNFNRDVGSLMDWENASNVDRSLMVVGSFRLDAVVMERSERKATVQFTAVNSMTLGSAIGPDGFRDVLNTIPGSAGPFSEVVTTFTWNESISW